LQRPSLTACDAAVTIYDKWFIEEFCTRAEPVEPSTTKATGWTRIWRTATECTAVSPMPSPALNVIVRLRWPPRPTQAHLSALRLPDP
jgi:hypothetical protein